MTNREFLEELINEGVIWNYIDGPDSIWYYHDGTASVWCLTEQAAVYIDGVFNETI